jgi:hypothetical protein
MLVPGGASNRQFAVALLGGLGSGSRAWSAPFAPAHVLAVVPPGVENGTHPKAAFGCPSGSVQDVTRYWFALATAGESKNKPNARAGIRNDRSIGLFSNGRGTPPVIARGYVQGR